ncbi:MAG: tRNA 2-thiouridine(34) synthase MnmA [Candidatus Tectomicrobia bacterium]|uniref:tRNA-specific 2-thiouridylase MnmA n=1 Tax=Tectimicrobiota bacterium TaxID=2528274 RepID=A0A932MMY6_UNCTE|nr:tRNA 2-thiouridine(34) synthase MnmA [Candidatus Tectomicrobia bacterium]
MRERVVVAMSGGVDSSVAAALLVERGYEVVGVGLRLADRLPGEAESFHRGCCAPRDLADARAVAARLGFPFYAMDAREAFRGAVVEGFAEAYLRGRTPNPCVDCNQEVKFHHLAERARALGAGRLATGHYARRVTAGGRLTLARSADRAKDQTYFLFGLTQAQLALAMFPLGDMEKRQVREAARRLGLPNAEKPESQEICFVPEGDYRRFLDRERPGWRRAGRIVDGDGNVLGAHEGVAEFTVGQRRGLGLGGGEPRFVVRLDSDTATVVAGRREELHRERFLVERVRWSLPIGREGRRLLVQVRHRQRPVPCLVRPRPGRAAEVVPEDPPALGAVAPGQAAVFYEGEVLQGGGWVAGE